VADFLFTKERARHANRQRLIGLAQTIYVSELEGSPVRGTVGDGQVFEWAKTGADAERCRVRGLRKSEFRDLRRRLLGTTGQVGATTRLLQREGAWELISNPPPLAETEEALTDVDPQAFQQEQAYVRAHRDCFRLQTRCETVARSI
jgi:hypothetical protein